MFGVIYALLFALWIFLLNDKIQKGPEPVSVPGRHPSGVLDAAPAIRGIWTDEE